MQDNILAIEERRRTMDGSFFVDPQKDCERVASDPAKRGRALNSFKGKLFLIILIIITTLVFAIYLYNNYYVM